MPRKQVEGDKPVAGYFRISKARDEMSAPEIYRGQIEDYCRYKRLKLGKLYSDIDFSGRRGSKPRPGLTEQNCRRYVSPSLRRPHRAWTRLGRARRRSA